MKKTIQNSEIVYHKIMKYLEIHNYSINYGQIVLMVIFYVSVHLFVSICTFPGTSNSKIVQIFEFVTPLGHKN